MLRVECLEVLYGDFQVLWDVSLAVREGEIVCLLGPNGAGKSTVMNATTALVPRRAGRVVFRGEDLAGVPTHEIVSRGLAHVLERRRLFPTLTVRQNLLLGGTTRARAGGAPSRSRGSKACSRCSPSAATSLPVPCPAASSRWSRSRAA